MEQELLDAIKKLNDTIESLGSNFGPRRPTGRGGRPAPGSNPMPASQASDAGKKLDFGARQLKAAAKNLSGAMQRLADMMIDQANSAAKSGDKLTSAQDRLRKHIEDNDQAIKKETDSRKDLTDAQEDATDATKKEKSAKLALGEATWDVVKSLADGSKDVESALTNLSGNASKASGNLSGAFSTAARVISGAAAGAAFALTMMNTFAKDARSASDFADLRSLSAGTITTQKLFSSLGDSFVKVINESGGAFRFFGATSEEAVKNLAQLSRGLRLGSADQETLNKLGPEYARYLRRASDATAALGLSQEEQAALSASIMNNVRLGARDERDAMRMMARQYTETTESARRLSQQFGVSARDILKSMQDFNRSRAGQALGAEGLGEEGGAVFAQLQQAARAMGANLSPEDLQAFTLDILQGQSGAAVAAIRSATANNPVAGTALENIIGQLDRTRESGQRLTGDAVTAALRRGLDQTAEIAQAYRGTTASQSTTREMRLGAEGLLAFRRQVEAGTGQQAADQAAQQRRQDERGFFGRLFGTRPSEAGNIQTTEGIQQTLNDLKGNFVNLITATMAVTGAFALLAATAGAGGLMSLIGSKLAGAGAAGAAGTAAAGAAGTAAAGTAAAAAGASRAAPVVGNAVAGATAASGAMSKLGQAGSAVASGPGQAIAGFFSAFGGPAAAAILKGAAVIAGIAALLGAGVGLALAGIAAGLRAFSWGLEGVTAIDGDNLAKVGEGIKSLGAGMLSFAVASGANVLGAVANGIAGIFGADIISRIKKAIDELTPMQAQLSIIGPAIQSFGEGLRAFGEAAANIDANRLARLFAVIRRAGSIDVDRLRSLGLVRYGASTAVGEFEDVVTTNQTRNQGASTPVSEFDEQRTPIVVSGRQLGYFDEVGTPTALPNNEALLRDTQAQINSMFTAVQSAIIPEPPAPTLPNNEALLRDTQAQINSMFTAVRPVQNQRASTLVDEFDEPRTPITVNGRQLGYFDEVGTPTAIPGSEELLRNIQSQVNSMLSPSMQPTITIPEVPATDIGATVGALGRSNDSFAQTQQTTTADNAGLTTSREVSDENFKQTLIAYLSTVADDIAAIRGNTRTSTGDVMSPVRLG